MVNENKSKIDVDLILDPPEEYEDGKCFGSIKFDDYLNEEGFGNINLGSNNKAGICKVFVYDIEGPIPHFHLKSKNFETCIKIYEPEYFKHDGKEGELNSNQRKKLDDWLSEKSSDNKYKTNWEEISDYWNTVHGVPKNATDEQPNYRKLK